MTKINKNETSNDIIAKDGLFSKKKILKEKFVQGNA